MYRFYFLTFKERNMQIIEKRGLGHACSYVNKMKHMVWSTEPLREKMGFCLKSFLWCFLPDGKIGLPLDDDCLLSSATPLSSKMRIKKKLA